MAISQVFFMGYAAGRAKIAYNQSGYSGPTTINVSSLSGYVSGKTDLTINVSSGSGWYSGSNSTPALTLVGGNTGDTVTIDFLGGNFSCGIYGYGGPGGSASSSTTGQSGGPALSLNGLNISSIAVTGNGVIAGGGGGGGAGFVQSAQNYTTYTVTVYGYPGGGGGGTAPSGVTSSGGSPVSINNGISFYPYGGYSYYCITAQIYEIIGYGQSGNAPGLGYGGQGGSGQIYDTVTYLNVSVYPYGASGPGGNGNPSNSNIQSTSNGSWTFEFDTYSGANGGGWGASGGNGLSGGGGSGGNAIQLFGHSVSFTSWSGSYYGAIS